MKKKILSLALAAVLTLGLSVTAFAAEEPTDMTSVTITKTYSAKNEGTTSPAETFAFTIENTSVTDAATGVTKDSMPTPTIDNVTYTAGEAGSENAAKNITITLPQYTSVGVYTYTINETAGTTAGVTYYSSDIKLVVTVIEGTDGKLRIAAVHTEDTTEQGAQKSDDITNTYSAGSLAVGKTVTGNLGDKTKGFKVTVTFTAPEGKTVNEAISYVVGVTTQTIATSDWDEGVATAVITLKDAETITFTNIPYDVTYTVVEDDYTSDGYDEATYNFSDSSKKIDSVSDTVQITNNKNSEVDTGINLDSLPYIMILVVLAGAAVVLFVSKKRRVE